MDLTMRAKCSLLLLYLGFTADPDKASGSPAFPLSSPPGSNGCRFYYGPLDSPAPELKPELLIIRPPVDMKVKGKTWGLWDGPGKPPFTDPSPMGSCSPFTRSTTLLAGLGSGADNNYDDWDKQMEVEMNLDSDNDGRHKRNPIEDSSSDD
ncbi:Uncharacterized protein APZ42_031474 [Daphnia magna]|uniref:Uncharacterized protein n=1 Tax=Daphnia magna TaxID=35525 RepID=A0A164MU74_9CRUS|nr:Uncharacterized protein APZ42_031474 [Daphnia magna]